MKKWMIPMTLLICILTLASCKPLDTNSGADGNGVESVKTYNDTEWLNDDTPLISDLETWDFDVQYIRAGTKSESIEYPAVRILRSADELNHYLQNETHMSDGLTDACKKYDDDYFKDQILLIVLLEEGSGSTRHEVERVGIDADKTIIEIKSIVPEVGTCDMAYWHVLIEPEADAEITSEDDVIVFVDGRNGTVKLNTVSHTKGYANISVTLKDGWEYDIVDEANTNEFSINIYPVGQSQNKIRIAYYNGFGVCGTELKQEQIMLGKYEAWMGTYDNNTVWDFISLTGFPGDYAILNEGGENWWNEYGEEAMQILATLKVADGFITSSDAIKIAKDKLNTDFDEVNTSYDAQNGIWTVTMSRRDGENLYTMVVTMDIYGSIQEMYNPDEFVCAAKPVIYLYPDRETEVIVKLDVNGNLICTYPAYSDGWTVTASPDGTLTDANGREFYCLYWEGELNADYDFSRGFCVKGEDTATFLEETLIKLGLNAREANEFIIYWLPQMEQNEYNLISFQQEAYTDTAELMIEPAPDSLLRVFMAWKPLKEAIEIEPQEFATFDRIGFTVVEWGGAKVQ